MSERTQASSLTLFRKRNASILVGVALVWLCFDLATKGFFNSFAQGTLIAEPLAGLFQFRLVHNTGAAWGMFGDSTFLLGILSLAVCTFLVVYLLVLSPRASVLEAAGIGLVVAGGLGNALDRFTLGYVVDFIEPVFINFPVFNIADIGVTCGFILFVAGMLRSYRKQEQEETSINHEAELPSRNQPVSQPPAESSPQKQDVQ